MILAIDYGSTSFKAAVFTSSTRATPLAAGAGKLAYRFAAGGRVELEVAEVHGALRRALAGVRKFMPGVQAIALTSQAQTFTVADARGRAQKPFISWQDSRAAAVCGRLRGKLPDFIDHCSFGDLAPALQVCQLFTEPPRGGDFVLPLPAYFVRLWTGESVIDNNLAALSGLYSLKDGCWWPKALKLCRLRASQLPRVVSIGAVAAHTTNAARAFGLPVGIPIVLAGNDQTAGAYAARLEENRGLLLTLGTAQVAYICATRPPRPASKLARGPYPGGRYYRMAADACGGNIINWAQSVLAGCGTDRHFFAQAARGRPGATFAADLDVGRGSWRQIDLSHTPADLARAILESLSQRMAVLVQRLHVASIAGPIWVAGGGSAQPLWCDLVSAALGAKLIPTEASPLLGAARMAVARERG